MRFALFTLTLLAGMLGQSVAAPPSAVSKKTASGAVIFYSPSAFDGATNIPIAVGLPVGAPAHAGITRYFKRTHPSLEPSCGAAGSATFSLPAGWYQWQSDRRCLRPDVVDGGAIEIKAGSCLKVAVASIWACP